MARIKRALVSVSDKTGVVELSRELVKFGVEIISTGGTEKALREAGIPVIPLADVTGFGEMLDGRVKTLHPHVHAGILADRNNPDHMAQLAERGIESIDLVVVNLYPFSETVAAEDVTLEDAIEQIDIGGVTLIRAAAKNHAHVGIVTEPGDYYELVRELEMNDGQLSEEFRSRLAVRGFRHTALYDAAIHSWLAGHEGGQITAFPSIYAPVFEKIQDVRYGENPHQGAAYYREVGAPAQALPNARQLQGKELSFNNVLDLNAAWALVQEFKRPAVAIIKHNNPCGVAVRDDLATAYQVAFGCDPKSAFGGIAAFNRTVDMATVEAIGNVFMECLIAPDYEPAALKALARKTDLRVLQLAIGKPSAAAKDLKRVSGGLLLQDYDNGVETREGSKVVSKREPTDKEWQDMLFAMRVCKHVKSNTIVLAKDGATVGIGAGQMSRIDSLYIAAMKAGERARGSSMASDAFFPFRDTVDEAAKHGVTAVIHTGGSLRDAESTAAADEAGMAMVTTGIRHFKH